MLEMQWSELYWQVPSAHKTGLSRGQRRKEGHSSSFLTQLPSEQRTWDNGQSGSGAVLRMSLWTDRRNSDGSNRVSLRAIELYAVATVSPEGAKDG